jgi:hypothetical protein
MHIKKYTEKDRYGNTFSYEFDVPSLQEIPKPDPSIFKPKGTDTVPAMLTPGENVVNAEASRLPGVQPMLDKLNDMGRVIQKEQGGPIPSYHAEGSKITPRVLDALMQVESGGDVNAVSPVGASGPYQIMETTGLNPGFGVAPISSEDRFNPEKSRAFADAYLKGIEKYNPDFSLDEILQSYHSGVGNVKKGNLGPEGQAYVPKIKTAMNENEVPMPEPRPVVFDDTPMESGFMSAQASTGDKEVPKEKGYIDQAVDYIKGIPEAFNKNLQYSEQLQREAVSPESLKQLERAAKYPLEIFGVPVPSDAPGKPTGTLYDKMYPVLDFLSPSANEVNQRISSQALEKIQPQIKDAKNQLDYMEKLISNIKKEGGQPNPSQIEKYESASKEYNELLKEEKNLKGLNKTHKEMVEKEKSKGKDFMLDSEKEKQKQLDEEKKKKAAQAILDQLANEEDIDQTVMTKEEVADYMVKNPGKTPADKFIDKAKEVGGVVLDKSMGYFKDAFSSMFDGEELARMAMIYAGSRAMGYGHGASLNYSMKNYVKRVEANQEYAKKAVLDKDFADRFTADSLAKYAKSADVNDLIPVGKSLSLQTVSGNVYIPGYGKATTFKGDDKIEYVQIEGIRYPVSSIKGVEKFDEKVHGDATVAKRYDTFGKDYADYINKQNNYNQGDKGYVAYKPIGTKANSIYRKILRQNGVNINDAPEMQMAVERAMGKFIQAQSDYKAGKIDIEPNDLESFVNMEVFTPLTGISQAMISGTSPENLAKINKMIKDGMENKNTRAPAYAEEYYNDWQGTLEAYKKVPKAEREVLIKEAAEKSKDGNKWSAFTLWVSRTSPDKIEELLKQ